MAVEPDHAFSARGDIELRRTGAVSLGKHCSGGIPYNGGFLLWNDTLTFNGAQAVGSSVTLVAEVPASATYAYQAKTFTITVDKVTPPALVNRVVPGSIYPWDSLYLYGVLGVSGMLDATITSGGGTVSPTKFYAPAGFVGTTVISVRVAGSALSYPSNWATITVVSALPTSPPVFTVQPEGGTHYVGTEVTLAAVATGAPTPTLQWRKNGVAIAGATGATLVLWSAQPSDSGSYTVAATNSVGVVVSQTATLTVTMPPPTILAPPVGDAAFVGETVTLTVEAEGNPAPTYQMAQGRCGALGCDAAQPDLC